MINQVALILDPAHGIDVPGKCSPDGGHKEYLWSREQLIMAYQDIIRKTGIQIHAPFLFTENEPGLTNRVLAYNEIAKAYRRTIMFSLHNDANPAAKCDAAGWGKAHGSALWTSRGDTDADPLATFLFNTLKEQLPDYHFRTAYWLNKGEALKDPDYEANFTVLAGNTHVKPLYDGILMEHLFQNNWADVQTLTNAAENTRFNGHLTHSLIRLHHYANAS